MLNKLTKSVACYLLGCFHSSLKTYELFLALISTHIGIATAAATAAAATPPVNQCLLHTHTPSSYTHAHTWFYCLSCNGNLLQESNNRAERAHGTESGRAGERASVCVCARQYKQCVQQFQSVLTCHTERSCIQWFYPVSLFFFVAIIVVVVVGRNSNCAHSGVKNGKTVSHLIVPFCFVLFCSVLFFALRFQMHW